MSPFKMKNITISDKEKLLNMSGHTALCRKRMRAQLALMSADREKEDTPIPTERLQLDGRTERAETTNKKEKDM